MQSIIVKFLVWVLPLVLQRFAADEKRGLIGRIIDRMRGVVPEADSELMAAAADDADLPGVLDIVQRVFASIPQETVQVLGDALFDLIEDAIANSSTKVDDIFLLPVIGLARKALEIPDNDEPAEADQGGPEMNL